MSKSLKQLLAENALSSQELARRERAARRLRDRLCVTPYYREMDRRYGMDFWRNLQASAALAD